jgi:hypothetical protein
MHTILQSVVGGPGPLIVEHKGHIFIEHCMMITDKHVNNMKNRLKDIQFYKLIQTTGRSFILT